MKGLRLSRAAAGLMRALPAAVLDADHRILLTDVRSVDWQSLTFDGERHEMIVKLVGPDALEVARRLVATLPGTEFAIPGHIVADIAARLAEKDEIYSVSVAIEALTVAD